MEFKKEIETVLKSLKNLGVERAQIEKDLGYRENYIDQTLSRGGNVRFLNNLKMYRDKLLHNAIVNRKSDVENGILITADAGEFYGTSTERIMVLEAMVKVLRVTLVEVIAKMNNASYPDTSLELDRKMQEELRHALVLLQKK